MRTEQYISKQELLGKIKSLVKNERKCTAEIIRHLQIVYERNIHLEMGYSSIFEFCVKELGYSNSSAHRRVSALRLAKDLPEVATKIEQEKLSLSTASQLSSFFYQEKNADTS